MVAKTEPSRSSAQYRRESLGHLVQGVGVLHDQGPEARTPQHGWRFWQQAMRSAGHALCLFSFCTSWGPADDVRQKAFCSLVPVDPLLTMVMTFA